MFIVKISLISSLLLIFQMQIDSGTGQVVPRGPEVLNNDFNYQVAIKAISYNWCGGAIVDEWHILTAGHCVSNFKTNQISVLAGSRCLDGHCGLIRNVSKIRHPAGYEQITEMFWTSEGIERARYHKNDLAVLTLESPLILGPEIGTLPLPNQNVSFSEDKSLCTLAGWGRTTIDGTAPSNRLFWSNSSLIEPQKYTSMNIRVHPNFICSQQPNGTTYLYGDSGSPLVCQGVAVGVVSTISVTNSMLMSVNVYEFLSFIKEAIEETVALKKSYINTESPKISYSCDC